MTRLSAQLALLSVAFAAQGAAGAAPTSDTRVYAARVPGGAVRVLTVVTDGAWPAGGLRIEDASGTVLVPHVEADSAAAQLDAASLNALRALQHRPAAGDPQARNSNAIILLRLLSDWAFARAAGAAIELPAGIHPGSIRVVLLTAAGAAATALAPVSVQEDAGPPPPTSLAGTAAPKGITLTWRAPARASGVPAFAYTVQRGAGAQHDALTLRPLVLTVVKPGEPFPFIDHAPPVEATVTYEVRLVDVLGVPSTAAAVALMSPDFEAGAPPPRLTASVSHGAVQLGWDLPPNSRATGLMVERAQLAAGPYEWLTPQGLSPQTTRFEDRNVLPGANYYYRVRAVTPGGALGAAPDPVHAQVLAPQALAAPQGLAAEVGTSRVVLTWKPVAGLDLAGYVVERRASASAPRWSRLNARLLPDSRYLDVIGPGAGGSFDYRVTAVASDEGHSPPSEALHVTLRDSEPPAPPVVLTASGAEGRVQIRFVPAAPAERTAQVALVRADSPAEAGLVIGAPVPAAAGVIEDTWVRAGQAYWYRLIAFDPSGNRSAESDAYSVRVGAVPLPTPKPPSVVYTAQPAPQVAISFEAPPAHVRAIVQVQLGDGAWRTVSGPTSENHAVDSAPPGPHATYRVVYVGESGGGGKPSDPASPR